MSVHVQSDAPSGPLLDVPVGRTGRRNHSVSWTWRALATASGRAMH